MTDTAPAPPPEQSGDGLAPIGGGSHTPPPHSPPEICAEVLEKCVVIDCEPLPPRHLCEPVRSGILCVGAIEIKQRLSFKKKRCGKGKDLVIEKVLPVQLLILEVDSD